MPLDTLPLLTFVDAATIEAWLGAEPENSVGAWLRFAKKGACEETITKSDAIDCALAHGWVDCQLGRIDDAFFKTRFMPRHPKSLWSQVNRERVERLLAADRITPRGDARIKEAKADGRWAAKLAPGETIHPRSGRD